MCDIEIELWLNRGEGKERLKDHEITLREKLIDNGAACINTDKSNPTHLNNCGEDFNALLKYDSSRGVFEWTQTSGETYFNEVGQLPNNSNGGEHHKIKIQYCPLSQFESLNQFYAHGSGSIHFGDKNGNFESWYTLEVRLISELKN